MIKKVLVLCLLMAAKSLSAQWKVDKTHSSITFAVAHMVVSEVEGQFTDFSGDVMSTKDDFSDAKIKFEIEAKSINTNDAKRDGHLKDKDFFDVATHPKIIFESTAFQKVGDKKYKLTGKLKMHGVEKSVDWDVDFKGIVKNMQGNGRVAGFKATAIVNRKDFGVSWNKTLDTGGLAIGDDVSITVKIELAGK